MILIPNTYEDLEWKSISLIKKEGIFSASPNLQVFKWEK